MKAYYLNRVTDLSVSHKPLDVVEIPVPVPRDDEVLLKVRCCGVCHTELDEIEGRTPPPLYPIVPGHQVIGVVEKTGDLATRFKAGDRIGVAWIFAACGECEFCKKGMENLCAGFKATGRDEHGGYAEYMSVNENFAYLIPKTFSDAQAAPLLCAGAIGYRSLRLSNLTNGQALGLSGFGGSGHLVLKLTKALYPDSPVYVFARSKEECAFAISLGAQWAGALEEASPSLVSAMIDTTPAWHPVVTAMEHIRPGGRLVINAIRKEPNDISALLRLNYTAHLWMEKEIKSVANITRSDVEAFLHLASIHSIVPEVQTYPFDRANEALWDLKNKTIKGAKVLLMR